MAAASQERRVAHKVTAMQEECKDMLFALKRNVDELQDALPHPVNDPHETRSGSPGCTVEADRGQSHDALALRELISSCEEICAEVKKGVRADILMLKKSRGLRKIDTTGPSDAATTCGIVLDGETIGDASIGGPAYASAQLERGDRITQVDGEDVTADTIGTALIGCDVPGSIVTLKVLSAASQVGLMLRAILSVKVRMFHWAP